MRLIIFLTGLLIASQVHGQGHIIRPSYIPHIIISVGANLQYWQDRNLEIVSNTQAKLQIGISYRLTLFKHLSFDPECIFKDNNVNQFIPRGAIVNGDPVQSNTQRVYSGISGQLTLPLIVRYKFLGIGVGVFLECPLSMDYQITLFNPTISPTKFYGRQEVNNQVGGGWQTSVEANYKRYQIRLSLCQRNKLIALKETLPTSVVTAFSLGYRL